MGRSTPHDSPTATTTSNAYWPPWASPRKTVTPTTHKPKAKSNASTKPSNAGSPPDPDRAPWPNSKPCSTPSAPSTTPSEPTAPTQAEPPPNTPTKPHPKPTPTANPAHTSASATTPSTNSANSPCATAADYTTSASAAPTQTPQY